MNTYRIKRLTERYGFMKNEDLLRNRPKQIKFNTEVIAQIED